MAATLPDEDSDGDGIPDAQDPFPLVAQYQDLKWEITSVSLDYNISHKMIVGATTESSSERTERTRGAFSWSLGADGKVEAAVQVGTKLSPNPFELFGLADSSVQAQFSAMGSLRGNLEKNRSEESAQAEARKSFFSITDQAAVGDLHLSFSVNFYNFSSHKMLLTAKPIPILIDERHVASAMADAEQIANGYIVIPALRRNKPILVSFKATLDNTKAYELVDWMRHGNSPVIDLANSQCEIHASGDQDSVDIISKLNTLLSKTQLLTVRTSGGSTTWRIAKRYESKPVTLQQALLAVNNLMRKTTEAGRDFFEFNTNGVGTIAGYQGDGTWFVRSQNQLVSPDKQSLKRDLSTPVEFALMERANIKEAEDKIMRAAGAVAEESALRGMQEDIILWEKLAQWGWPEALCLQAKCYDYGVGYPIDKVKAFALLQKAASSSDSNAMLWLSDCFRHGVGVAKDVNGARKV